MIDRIRALIRYFLGKTVVRYIISGGFTFVVNFGTIAILIEYFGMGETEFKRNVAHAIGAEASYLFAFHMHNWFTWQNSKHGNYWVKLFTFHMATFMTFALRQIGFFFLDQWGFHYLVATLFPLIIAIMINFVVYNFFIFKKRDGVEEQDEPAN